MTDRPADVFDVVVVGSSNLDIVATAVILPGQGETVMGRAYAEHPGGKGLNQAVAAARAGARTAFTSAIGADAAGDRLLQVMRDEGIDTAAVTRVGHEPTGRAVIGVADDGENSIIVISGANATVSVHDLSPAKVVLAQLEVPLDAIRTAFTAARSMGAITVLNPAPARMLDAELLQLCDIVVPNEHEVSVLGGVDHLLALGAHAVVVTQGRRGATATSTDAVEAIAAFTVDPVDTTGAGDTFCGALCARLALGDPLPAALRYASAAAALSTTREGAVPSIPTADDVAGFILAAG